MHGTGKNPNLHESPRRHQSSSASPLHPPIPVCTMNCHHWSSSVLPLRPPVPVHTVVHTRVRASGEEREYGGKDAPTPPPPPAPNFWTSLQGLLKRLQCRSAPLSPDPGSFTGVVGDNLSRGRSTLCDHIITLCFSCTSMCLVTSPAIQLS
jgi:hypothetical protein